MKLIGILLIVFGIVALVLGGITYTDREQVLDLGPVEAVTETEETIPLSPIVGIGCEEIAEDVLARPWVPAYFVRHSVLWGAVHVANAGLTLWLLLTQPLATYVLAKTVVGWSLSGSAFVWSVTSFRRQLHRDGGVEPRERARG